MEATSEKRKWNPRANLITGHVEADARGTEGAGSLKEKLRDRSVNGNKYS